MKHEHQLTNDHRRLLGTAILMAKADGVLDRREQALIDDLSAQLHLSADARLELARMVDSPPTPEQIAEWNVTDRDRLGVYAVAARVAQADGIVDPAELALLDRLADILRITAEDKAEISRQMEEEQP